jgi:hypothetical protein
MPTGEHDYNAMNTDAAFRLGISATGRYKLLILILETIHRPCGVLVFSQKPLVPEIDIAIILRSGRGSRKVSLVIFAIPGSGRPETYKTASVITPGVIKNAHIYSLE